eukprot:14255922-Alexandrium_andersonii.AAC.1
MERRPSRDATARAGSQGKLWPMSEAGMLPFQSRARGRRRRRGGRVIRSRHLWGGNTQGREGRIFC